MRRPADDFGAYPGRDHEHNELSSTMTWIRLWRPDWRRGHGLGERGWRAGEIPAADSKYRYVYLLGAPMISTVPCFCQRSLDLAQDDWAGICQEGWALKTAPTRSTDAWILASGPPVRLAAVAASLAWS